MVEAGCMAWASGRHSAFSLTKLFCVWHAVAWTRRDSGGSGLGWHQTVQQCRAFCTETIIDLTSVWPGGKPGRNPNTNSTKNIQDVQFLVKDHQLQTENPSSHSLSLSLWSAIPIVAMATCGTSGLPCCLLLASVICHNVCYRTEGKWVLFVNCH